MDCKKCNAKLKSSADFCTECGTKTVRASVPTTKPPKQQYTYLCDHCKSIYQSSTNHRDFCMKCKSSGKQYQDITTLQCVSCSHEYPVRTGKGTPCPQCDGGAMPVDPRNAFDGQIVDRLQLAAYFIVGIGAVSAIITFFSLNAASANAFGFVLAVLVAAFVVVVGLVAAVTYFALAEIVRRLQSIDHYVQAIKSENEGG